jgi:hypothetical protein
MTTKSNRVLLQGAVALALAVPPLALAESNINSGAGSPITASARLDFQIVVPKVLFLQVGAGTNMAANATINQIAFSVPAANIGDGSVVAATAGSGDLGNGQVTAKVVGNNGTITFTSTTLGALGNGAGDTISYADIATTVAANTSATPLAHPALADASTTTVTLTPASGKVINRDAKWTYAYANTAVAAPGTYGGVNTNNSRVTYTASMP